MIPLTLVIMRGHVVPLTSLFLGLLYHELDEIHAFEEQVVSSVPIKSFLCVSFLQIFRLD